MRFMTTTARLSFAALIASAAIALAAGFGTRLHLWDYQVGLLRIFPYSLYVGLAALAFGIVWMAVGNMSVYSHRRIIISLCNRYQDKASVISDGFLGRGKYYTHVHD